MEIILLFAVGFIGFMILMFSVVKMTTNKVTAPTNDLKDEVIQLKKRLMNLKVKRNKSIKIISDALVE